MSYECPMENVAELSALITCEVNLCFNLFYFMYVLFCYCLGSSCMQNTNMHISCI